MATGLASTRTVTGTVTKAAPTLSVAKTAGSRITSVDVQYLAPEVSLAGYTFSDATGQAAVVSFSVLGPTTTTAYPVRLSVSEVTDA